MIVELEGVEPSSKRGNNKLSTCLSLSEFSCTDRTKAIKSIPYPLWFHPEPEAVPDYPRFNCTTLPECFGATASE